MDKIVENMDVTQQTPVFEELKLKFIEGCSTLDEKFKRSNVTEDIACQKTVHKMYLLGRVLRNFNNHHLSVSVEDKLRICLKAMEELEENDDTSTLDLLTEKLAHRAIAGFLRGIMNYEYKPTTIQRRTQNNE